MSHENVEIVKRAVNAFNRRDFDELAETVTPDAELVPAMAGIVEGEPTVGRETWSRRGSMMSDTWEERCGRLA